MKARLYRLGLLLTWLLVLWVPAYAQTTARAMLFAPDSNAFPEISLYFDAYNDAGLFLHGLQAGDVRIREDAQAIPVESLVELRPGAQLVIAINPGDSFGIRNSQGATRYDFIAEALVHWAEGRSGSTLDDLSALITAGPVITHFSDTTELISALEAHEFDPNNTEPSIDTLFRAVDIAADPTPRPGMKRAVLFVTSPLEDSASFGLQDLISRANQQGVRVFVWMVASADVFDSPGADQLRGLAEQTGGAFFAFSTDETLPSPEEYFMRLRDVYRVSYISEIVEGGMHELQVNINTGEQQIESEPLILDLDLQPPNPAFISPSVEITRKLPQEAIQNPWEEVNISELTPNEQVLQVLVDFPDGRLRSLVYTRLYIDGKLTAENNEPPFEYFTWDLSEYTQTNIHILQVEALDSLGLTGTSIEIPVEVKVDLPERNLLAVIARQGPVIVALVVLLAGAVLTLVLIVGGRIGPNTLGGALAWRRNRRRKTDPVTQPVPVKDEPRLGSGAAGRRLTGWVNRLNWPQRRLSPKPHAYLVRIGESEDTPTEAPIPVTSDELTFGRDKNLAILVVPDGSVEALHARLIRLEDGTFRLADEGSVAGTWINYTPVSSEGAPVEHGDLIHIGRVGFRFKLREPQVARQLTITPQRTPRDTD